jgi:hypothetical protein
MISYLLIMLGLVVLLGILIPCWMFFKYVRYVRQKRQYHLDNPDARFMRYRNDESALPY